jgi:hypothetical protein
MTLLRGLLVMSCPWADHQLVMWQLENLKVLDGKGFLLCLLDHSSLHQLYSYDSPLYHESYRASS